MIDWVECQITVKTCQQKSEQKRSEIDGQTKTTRAKIKVNIPSSLCREPRGAFVERAKRNLWRYAHIRLPFLSAFRIRCEVAEEKTWLPLFVCVRLVIRVAVGSETDFLYFLLVAYEPLRARSLCQSL